MAQQAQMDWKNLDVQALLQDRRVQIGLGVAVVLGILIYVLLAFVIKPGTSGVAPAVGTDPMMMEPGMPGGNGPTSLMPGGVPMGDSGAMNPNLDTMGVGGGFGPMAGSQGAGAAAAPASNRPEKDRELPAGVRARGNPFQPNSDMREVIRSIDPYRPPPDIGVPHGLYNELNPPKYKGGNDPNEGPPIPAMRLTGVVMGSQVSGLLQMGSEYIQVTPGKMIPENNPTYRVDRIEADKVVLSRRWEFGTRKGTQRFEVPLAAGSEPPPFMGFGAPAGGFGGAGMMPGRGAGGNGPR